MIKKVIALLFLAASLQAAPTKYVQVDPPTAQPGGINLSKGIVSSTATVNPTKASATDDGYALNLGGYTPLEIGNAADMPTSSTTRFRWYGYLNATVGFWTYQPYFVLNSLPNGLRIQGPAENDLVVWPTSDGVNGTFSYFHGQIIPSTGTLAFADSTNSHWVGFKSSKTVAADTLFTLPAADGTAGQVLTTDGNKTFSFSSAGTAGTIYISSHVSTAGSWNFTVSGSTWTTIDCSTITPHGANDVIRITVLSNYQTLSSAYYTFFRGSINLVSEIVGFGLYSDNANHSPLNVTFLDKPNTTSQTIYCLKGLDNGGGTLTTGYITSYMGVEDISQ